VSFTRAIPSRISTAPGPDARPAPPLRQTLEIGALRRWIGPAVLLVTTPVLVIVLHLVCAQFDGSIAAFVAAMDWPTFVSLVPRPTALALGILVGWVALQALLLVALPGPTYHGPVTPTGHRPEYRLNGVAAWAVTHGVLLATWAAGLWSASAVYRELGSMLVILNVFALALCGLLYVKGRVRPSSADATYTGHFLFDFFQGIELHPRAFGVSLKQLVNCRVSMMGWSALFVVFALHQHEAHGAITTSMAISAGLVIVYLLKFFVWEGGYFHSLDVMHDRFGYYICWGVLVWVPGVYTIFGQYLAEHPRDLPPALAMAIALTGLAALWVNYAADAQRQRVRATDGRTTVWGRAPRTLVARYRTTDGAERTNLLLTSGYWGLARHFHYVPELVLALCWALPAGLAHVTPYFYFVFLTILLVDRAGRDDARCAAKYGAAWDEYRRLVPYKIVPGIY
jgi:7-dehydrocholesterol reductase